jgi:hypothetical protein
MNKIQEKILGGTIPAKSTDTIKVNKVLAMVDKANSIISKAIKK